MVNVKEKVPLLLSSKKKFEFAMHITKKTVRLFDFAHLSCFCLVANNSRLANY